MTEGPLAQGCRRPTRCEGENFSLIESLRLLIGEGRLSVSVDGAIATSLVQDETRPPSDNLYVKSLGPAAATSILSERDVDERARMRWRGWRIVVTS